MIDGIDNALQAWIAAVLGDVEVSLEAPGVCPQEACIGLYLLELQQAPPAERGRSQCFSLTLRYLVTSWDAVPLTAHRRLGELAAAVAAHPEYQLDLVPLPAAVWAAFGTGPRPAFTLAAPLVWEPAAPAARIIREQPIVRTRQLTRFEGLLLGPGSRPVVGAHVELCGSGRRAVSDHRGRFSLVGVPAEPLHKRLRVRAKGRDLDVTAEHLPDRPEPVTIHLELTET